MHNIRTPEVFLLTVMVALLCPKATELIHTPSECKTSCSYIKYVQKN